MWSPWWCDLSDHSGCWVENWNWSAGAEAGRPPGGFRCYPAARCDGGSGWGVVVKWREKVGSWICLEEATEFSDKLSVEDEKNKKGVKGGFWGPGKTGVATAEMGTMWPKGLEEKIRSLVSEAPGLVGDSRWQSSGTGGTRARHGQRSLVWEGDVSFALCIISVYNESAFPRRNGLLPSSLGNFCSFL